MQIDQQILNTQLQRFVVIILLGFFARKIGLMNDELHDKLNTTIMRLIVPAQLISAVARSNSGESVRLILPMTVGGLAVFCLLFAFGRLSGLALGFRGDKLRVHTGATFVGSIGFFGIPLVTSLLGGLGAAAFGLFTIVDNLYVWTVGLQMSRSMTDNKEKMNIRWALRQMMEPATLSIFVAWGVLLLRLPSDNVLLTSLTTIGDCAGPLAMLCIGITIARSDWRILPRSWTAMVIVALRMVAAPIIIYRVCMLLNIYQPATICLALTAGMPSSSMFALMCKDNGNTAADYAVGAAILTVFASVLTLPLVVRLMV